MLRESWSSMSLASFRKGVARVPYTAGSRGPSTETTHETTLPVSSRAVVLEGGARDSLRWENDAERLWGETRATLGVEQLLHV